LDVITKEASAVPPPMTGEDGECRHDIRVREVRTKPILHVRSPTSEGTVSSGIPGVKVG
jgi:hypothetical protein